MSSKQIKAAIKEEFDDAAQVRVYFTEKSGAGQLNAQVKHDSNGQWRVSLTDYDGSFEEYRVEQFDLQAPANEVGYTIGRWARDACDSAPAVAPAPILVAEPQPPVAPAVAPYQARPPSSGQGLLATTLTLGFGGMAVGIAGFAVAYHFEQRYNDAKSRGDVQQMFAASSDAGLALGIGTAGAAMLGTALILIVPTSIRLTRRNAASRRSGGATLSPVLGPRSGLSLRF